MEWSVILSVSAIISISNEGMNVSFTNKTVDLGFDLPHRPVATGEQERAQHTFKCSELTLRYVLVSLYSDWFRFKKFVL